MRRNRPPNGFVDSFEALAHPNAKLVLSPIEEGVVTAEIHIEGVRFIPAPQPVRKKKGFRWIADGFVPS